MTGSPSRPLGDLSNRTPSPQKRAYVGGDGVNHNKSARRNGLQFGDMEAIYMADGKTGVESGGIKDEVETPGVTRHSPHAKSVANGLTRERGRNEKKARKAAARKAAARKVAESNQQHGEIKALFQI